MPTNQEVPTNQDEQENPNKSFPIEIFPPILQLYCKELAESLVVPIDFPACAILTISSGLIGAKWKIQIKKDWMEKAIVFLAIVADVSAGKSPIMLKCMSIVFEIEEELEKKNQEEEKKYQVVLGDYEAKLASYRKEKKEKPKAPEKPIPKTLFTSDVTVEAVADMLKNNPAILIFRDELTAWISALNQYKGGKGSDREFFLSSWSGSPIKVDRKREKPIFIQNPFLSILGGLVPDKLSIFKGDDGLLERILFCYPEPIRKDWSDKEVSSEVRQEAQSSLKSLYEEFAQTKVVVLQPRAQEIFANYYKTLLNLNDSTKAFCAKLISYTARFALILTLLHQRTVCNAWTMEKAISLAQYFFYCFEKVSSEITIDEEERSINAILAWMKRHEMKIVTIRELYRARLKGCENAKKTKAASQKMVDAGFAIWRDGGKAIEILA